jgi:hypothetical protein
MITKTYLMNALIKPFEAKYDKSKWFKNDDEFMTYIREIYALLKYNPNASEYIEKMLSFDVITGSHVLARWINDEKK